MVKKKLPDWANTVTPFSKFIALVLFILLPYSCFILGLRVGANNLTAPPINYLVVPSLSANTASVMINEVQVKRSVSSFTTNSNNPSVSIRMITDAATAQVLYDMILNLPPYPTQSERSLPESCAENEKQVLYELIFLNNGIPVKHAVVSMTGCSHGWWVTLDESYKREFYSDIHLSVPLRSLLESSLGLTYSQLDGGSL